MSVSPAGPEGKEPYIETEELLKKLHPKTKAEVFRTLRDVTRGMLFDAVDTLQMAYPTERVSVFEEENDFARIQTLVAADIDPIPERTILIVRNIARTSLMGDRQLRRHELWLVPRYIRGLTITEEHIARGRGKYDRPERVPYIFTDKDGIRLWGVDGAGIPPVERAITPNDVDLQATQFLDLAQMVESLRPITHLTRNQPDHL